MESKTLDHRLVGPLAAAVGFWVVCGRHLQLDTRKLVKGFPELRYKYLISIADYV